MKHLLSIGIFLFCSYFSIAQERLKKVEFFGKARTNLLHQNLNVEEDTTNPNKANYGHSLIDLGILIRPSNSPEIITDLRFNHFSGNTHNATRNKPKNLAVAILRGPPCKSPSKYCSNPYL